MARYKILYSYLLLSNAPIARAQDKRARLFGPPTLLWFSAGARGPGAPGVGVRCDNGLLSTNKSPNFTLASLSQSFQLYLEYPVRVGLMNAVRRAATTDMGAQGDSHKIKLESC